jgi:hypothetical protein
MYAECFAYASQLAEQADRLGVPHNIAEIPPQCGVELSMMRSQIQDVEAKLSELIGKSAKGADFLNILAS